MGCTPARTVLARVLAHHTAVSGNLSSISNWMVNTDLVCVGICLVILVFQILFSVGFFWDVSWGLSSPDLCMLTTVLIAIKFLAHIFFA